MKKELARLLKRKRLGGAELGEFLLRAMVLDIKSQGKERVPAEKITELTEKVAPSEAALCRAYSDLYTTANGIYADGLAQYHLTGAAFLTMYDHLRNISLSELIVQSYSLVPCIVERKQYEEAIKASQQSYLNEEAPFFVIVAEKIQAYAAKRDAPPEELKGELRRLAEEPATNAHAIEKYAKYRRPVIYKQLPDGTRSDQATPEEWEKAATKDYLSRHPLKNDGTPATGADIKQMIQAAAEERKKRIEQFFFLGVDSNHPQGLKAYYLKAKGRALKVAGKKKDALTDFIEAEAKKNAPILASELLHNISEVYTASSAEEWPIVQEIKDLLAVDYGGTIHIEVPAPPPPCSKLDLLLFYTEKAQMLEGGRKYYAAIKAEYKTVYDLVKKETEKEIPEAQGIHPARQETAKFKRPIAGNIAQEIPPMSEDIARHYLEGGEDNPLYTLYATQMNHSIAFMEKNPQDWRMQYKAGAVAEFISTVERAIPGISEMGDMEEIAIEQAQKSFNSGLSRLLFDVARLKLLAEVYQSEALTELAGMLEKWADIIVNRADLFNGLLLSTYAKGFFATEKQTEEKRKALKAMFAPVDIDALAPDKNELDKIKTHLQKLGLNKAAMNFILASSKGR